MTPRLVLEGPPRVQGYLEVLGDTSPGVLVFRSKPPFFGSKYSFRKTKFDLSKSDE
jgi:hypothetical protein